MSADPAPLAFVDTNIFVYASAADDTVRAPIAQQLLDQLMAAARSGATRLYTEDLQHGRTVLGVEIVNPFRRARRS